MEIEIIGLIIVLAALGWIFYRKANDKPVIPKRSGGGSSKPPRKLN